ncbi:MAG: cysteinyl-tRNA synthetase [Anaerolineales bacterium]
MSDKTQIMPGLVVLFGSGETTPSGRKIFEHVFRQLPPQPRVAILETPAGFELNSAQVAGRVADFLRQRLKNYQPQIDIVAARKLGTPNSPDNPELIAPLWKADMVFMGPGSPSYATRQLQGSLAWQIIEARHRLGMSVTLASAATVAVGKYAIPVYEIYKVGEDIHWKEGLNLLGAYELPVVFVPHWNNNDGGEELDTSRCFMGKARFEPLLEMLPDGIAVVGIDEQTGLLLDLLNGVCRVVGREGISLIRGGRDRRFLSGETFAMTEMGDFEYPEPSKGLSLEVWKQAISAKDILDEPAAPPAEIVELVEKRESARAQKEWEIADDIREQIHNLGWQVMDTEEGPELEKVKSISKK